MIKTSRTLILILILITPILSLPSTQPARAANAWVKGLYAGWVYFQAKTDYQYSKSMAGASMQFEGVKFFESHGDLECTVFDEAGSGHCAASFPMDLINGASGTFSGPGCSGTVTVSSRANAVNAGPALAPLTNHPLDEGFSVFFNPQAGPENGTIAVTTSGCPGGGANLYQIAAGQPKWPQLDFHLEYHTPLTIGGSCSMEGLPRSITVGAMSSTLSLAQCQWRAIYFDPYAELPKE